MPGISGNALLIEAVIMRWKKRKSGYRRIFRFAAAAFLLVCLVFLVWLAMRKDAYQERPHGVCITFEDAWNSAIDKRLEFESVPPEAFDVPLRARCFKVYDCSKSAKLPVFKGYSARRLQKHDRMIISIVRDFNRRKAYYAGATPAQAATIPDLDPALVKSIMLEESGGKSAASVLAWNKDPLQVNVPGDWNKYKVNLGLKFPKYRNEGLLRHNIAAGVAFLARKGFGRSGQPAANRPNAVFDGWRAALRRYNGRVVKDAQGRIYADLYVRRIFSRIGQ